MTRAAGSEIPSIEKKKDKTRKREAARGTAEENVSLAAGGDERLSKEDDEEAATRTPRGGTNVDAEVAAASAAIDAAARGLNGSAVRVASRGGDEVHVEVAAGLLDAAFAPPLRDSRDDGVDLDDVTAQVQLAEGGGSAWGAPPTRAGPGAQFGFDMD